jgi:hypothetical protein
MMRRLEEGEEIMGEESKRVSKVNADLLSPKRRLSCIAFSCKLKQPGKSAGKNSFTRSVPTKAHQEKEPQVWLEPSIY